MYAQSDQFSNPRSRITKLAGLTDTACRNAVCPEGKKKIRLYDSEGLYLEVSSTSKRWFFKYRRPDRTETRKALGIYPLVSLKAAREATSDARLQLRQGVDPIRQMLEERLQKQQVQGETFEVYANAWYKHRSANWGVHHQIRERRNLDKDLIPWIGKRPVGEITAPLLLSVLRKIEERKALDVAHRVLTTAKGVLGYAVACGKAERNCALDLKEALKPHSGKHFGAIIEPEKFGELLLTIDGYTGGPIVRAAMKLAPMLFQRPTELRAAKWEEFDLDAGLWRIPAQRMKRRKKGKEEGADHFVPLPSQAVDILRDLQCLTGAEGYLFPGERGRSRPISDSTMRVALQSLGYNSNVQTIHGYRASARTMLDEQLEIDVRLIEAQLAHAVRDANGEAYNRAKFLHQRKAMMQTWANYLEKLKADAARRMMRLVA